MTGAGYLMIIDDGRESGNLTGSALTIASHGVWLLLGREV